MHGFGWVQLQLIQLLCLGQKKIIYPTYLGLKCFVVVVVFMHIKSLVIIEYMIDNNTLFSFVASSNCSLLHMCK
jgi:hypothetical protein